MEQFCWGLDWFPIVSEACEFEADYFGHQLTGPMMTFEESHA